jgi:hypothetical protein
MGDRRESFDANCRSSTLKSGFNRRCSAPRERQTQLVTTVAALFYFAPMARVLGALSLVGEANHEAKPITIQTKITAASPPLSQPLIFILTFLVLMLDFSWSNFSWPIRATTHPRHPAARMQ